MEDYFERVVSTLTGAGYRWYETANFCRDGMRARHNLGYWLGHDYLGLGVGAVSTIENSRTRNTPKLARYLAGAYDREVEPLDEDAARAAFAAARTDGIAACAVALIHAWKYPDMERRLKALAEEAGFAQVSASHEVSPLLRLVPPPARI